MENVTIVDTGSTTFTFTNEHGQMIAFFRINPTDTAVLNRWRPMAEAFANDTTESMEEYEETVQKRFCEFLGYDCKASLFGRVSATAIMADGRCFAQHVLDALALHIGPEIKRRREERLSRYLGKYNVGTA